MYTLHALLSSDTERCTVLRWICDKLDCERLPVVHSKLELDESFTALLEVRFPLVTLYAEETSTLTNIPLLRLLILDSTIDGQCTCGWWLNLAWDKVMVFREPELLHERFSFLLIENFVKQDALWTGYRAILLRE